MLYWSMIFFVAALVAGFFGFWGIAGASSGIGQALFFVLLLAFIVSLIIDAAQSQKSI